MGVKGYVVGMAVVVPVGEVLQESQFDTNCGLI